ncbi:hypothetical protein BO79DRAFT_13010 [Aspergillus costaricaensis CBS 115574]|uniref:Uncharacterized protein n=1 Tax=Aspergillus costaricaensis CBS 115574 TaxID=1448317 RepID=A0ACD1IF25_9EURO|nr:hypothetical protein BO79DRAFT_13010 [Aspergillus costaricaensis CBS 115574]RAK89215.1 hypothetical protein BO79DRAFT_13010 [Aspergillus costaricaensis CBS 115574]
MHTLKSLLLTAITLSSTLTTTAATTTTPAYSITEPTSGAIISLNTATVISWNTTEPSTSKLSIHLSKTTNETTNLYTIATNISNSGSISWSPPSRVGTGSDYIVVLEPSSSSETYTSSPFTISSSTNASTTYYPTEGEVVKTGQTTIITWEVERNVSEVSIYLMEGELSNGNGTANGSGLKNVTTITTDIANSGDVACVLPGSVKSGDDYRFAIVDVKDVGRVKYSAVFEVVNSGDDSSSSSDSGDGSGSGTSDSSGSSSSGDGSGSAAGTGKETSGAVKVWGRGWRKMGWGVVGLVVGSLLV